MKNSHALRRALATGFAQRRRWLTLLSTATAIASPALAQAINIDIGLVKLPPATYGAAGRIGTWNEVPVTASAFPLVDTSGAPTNVTTTCSPSGVQIVFVAGNPVPPVIAMLNDAHDLGYFFPGPGPLYTWTVDGLANGTYRVIVYSTSTSGVIGGETEITIVGGSQGPQTCVEPYPSYEQLKYGASFAMDVVQVTAGSLSWTLRTLDGNGKFNGAQIEPIVAGDVHNYCEAIPNSQSCIATIFATGDASSSANTLRVKAANAINNKPGLLFWARAPGAYYSGPFGGYSCITPPIARTPVQMSGGNAPPDDCSGTYSFHFNAAYASSSGISAGDTIFCQYWQRDPAQHITRRNLSAGLYITFAP